MKTCLLVTAVSLTLLSLTACIGKGKAPPPVPEAPIVRKG
jgi:predicted small lipoprotein YifL